MVSDEINLILASVSSITEIPPEDILSKSKQSDIVDARYIVVKILKKLAIILIIVLHKSK